MAHWPRTVRGNLITLFVGGLALFIVGWILVVLVMAGPVIWGSALAIVAISGILFVRNRLAAAANDKAMADAPSFVGKVLPSHDPEVREPAL
ncbi:MAG TPA: hypothetical protein VF984_00755 [Actinomycetota bacterium]